MFKILRSRDYNNLQYRLDVLSDKHKNLIEENESLKHQIKEAVKESDRLKKLLNISKES